jgi:hypothetical protein
MNKVQKFAQTRKPDRPKEDGLEQPEKQALAKIQSEAKQKGVTLESGGKGGLPPSLVLGIFRRDEWKCKICGGTHNLSIHHKAGAKNLVSKALLKKGHSNDPSNLVCICNQCHDKIHTIDREVGAGKAVEKPAKKR